MMAKKKSSASEVEQAQVDAGENAIFNKETEGLSQSQIVFRRFIRHRAAMIAAAGIFRLAQGERGSPTLTAQATLPLPGMFRA